MPSFMYCEHNFEIKFESGGYETILYDGKPVSSKRGKAAHSVHNFTIDEKGEKASYEVDIRLKGGVIFGLMRPQPKVIVTVFRNGQQIYQS